MQSRRVPRAEERWVYHQIRNPYKGWGSTHLTITMLGTEGVGKTSLLAAMYERFEQEVRGAGLQLSAVRALAMDLHAKVGDLQGLFGAQGGRTSSSDRLQLNLRGGVPGTAETHVYPFRIEGHGRHRLPGALRLDFVDYPGSYVDERPDQVIDYLRDSHAVLIPVDAPALMEHAGVWNRMRNRPEFVYDLVSRAFVNLDSPRLVILCPIRCERYLGSARDGIKLLRRTTDSYGRLLDHLAFGDLHDLVAVVVTPVQTLGDVVLDRIPDSTYAPVFRKTHPHARYAPVDTEQPLRYLLRFAIELRIRQQSARTQQGLPLMAVDWAIESPLRKAAKYFAERCRDTGPFAVIQGTIWLGAAA